MVKVRIEYKGQVREFEEDAVIAFFPGGESAHTVIMGGTNIGRVEGALSAVIPSILEKVSDDRVEYVSAMIGVHESLDKKIKEELRAGGVHPVVDALAKTIEEELKK